jgi:Plasmid pRiA4b ORF-3-like protein
MAKSFQRYTLHVQLLYIQPPVWRRITVEGPDSLRKLHHILQAAFGWEDTHLHDFLIDGKTYAQFDIEAGLEFMDLTKTFDDRKTKLNKVLRPDSRIIYRYDFGDGWDHQIKVESIETIEGELTLPLFDEPHNRGSYAAWPCWAASQFFSNVMGLT